MKTEAEKVFKYMANNMSQDKDEYYSVRMNAGVPEEEDFKKAVLELTTAGLLEVNFVPREQSYIQKTKEFYHAQRLGLDLWYRQHLLDTEREKKKIEHDSIISKRKAGFWWISIVALILSLVSLVYSFFT